MMNNPIFIQCSIPSVELSKQGEIQNNPVNIALCKTFSRQTWTDGYGRKYPKIIFQGAEWIYPKDDFATRDDDFDSILHHFGFLIQTQWQQQ